MKNYKGIITMRDNSRRVVYGGLDMVARFNHELKSARDSIFKSTAVVAGLAVCEIVCARFIDAMTHETFIEL